MRPAYLTLTGLDEIAQRADLATARLRDCTLCPRRCRVDRLVGEQGYCRVGPLARIASVGPHFGEERPLVGWKGSGTIFLSSCNMRCVYCQNYPISHRGEGTEVTDEEFGLMMLSLQERGCHNINLVTPSHVVPMVLRGLLFAARNGLNVPLVYNTGGYDAVETLKLLDGIVDIYMPDIKYADNEVALYLSDAPHYWDVVRETVSEMQHQVGDLTIKGGIARRGLLIRHLVLPGGLAGSSTVLNFIAGEISQDTYVNVMEQYQSNLSEDLLRCITNRPGFKDLCRGITRSEYQEVISCAASLGLHRGVPGSAGE